MANRPGAATIVAMRWVPFAATVAATVLAAACGSTAPADGASPAPVPGADRVDAGVDAALVTGLEGASGAPAASTGTGRRGVTVPPTGPAGTPDAGAADAAGEAGAPLKIGVRYWTDEGIQTSMAMYGMDLSEVPRQRDTAEALIADLNALGGIRGHQVVPVWVGQEPVSPRGQAESDQAACAAMTEDDHVFAAIQLAPIAGGAFLSCMADRRVPVIANPLASVDAAYIAKLGGYAYFPSMPESTRMARFWIDLLARDAWFGTDARVGIVYPDDPYGINHRTVEQIVADLDARDIVLTETAGFATAPTPQLSEVGAAALRFKERGITNVIILDALSLVATTFMLAADQQDYHPTYGLTSFSIGANLEQSAPREQLRNVTLVSWMPTFDNANSRIPEPNAEEAGCLDTVRAHTGADLNGTLARGSAYWACDAFALLREGLGRASAVAPDALGAGVGSIGRWWAMGTFGARFTPGRADGPSVVRVMRFDDGCDCLRYVTGPVDVG